MPAKFWINEGESKILTGWDTVLDPEEFRPVAEELDQRLDRVLDDAVARLASPEVASVQADSKFKMLWSFGRAVKDSGILNHHAMKNEKQIFLWRVMAAKARLGIASVGDGKQASESDRWRVLRDPKQPDVTNKGGGVQDLYETAIWLQQHDLEEAAFIFGGNLGNAREIGARKGVNVPNLRRALATWLGELSDDQRHEVHKRNNFQLVAKALTRRWPFRGFGSARRPEHLEPEELLREVRDALQPVIAQLFET